MLFSDVDCVKNYIPIKVNNMAIMVSDLSKSLNFYTNIIGMERVESPHFDRFAVKELTSDGGSI